MSCSAHPGIWFWLKTKTKNQNISWNFLLFFQGWCHFGPKNIIFRASLLLKIHTIFLNIPALLAVKIFVAFFHQICMFSCAEDLVKTHQKGSAEAEINKGWEMFTNQNWRERKTESEINKDWGLFTNQNWRERKTELEKNKGWELFTHQNWRERKTE